MWLILLFLFFPGIISFENVFAFPYSLKCNPPDAYVQYYLQETVFLRCLIETEEEIDMVVNWFYITPEEERKGVRGRRGPVGKRGMTGPVGVKGGKGKIGPVGETGPKGVQGAPGAPGAVGIKGPQGDRGDKGPSGPRGSVGPQGSAGWVGVSGPKGNRGPKGATGDRGPGGTRLYVRSDEHQPLQMEPDDVISENEENEIPISLLKYIDFDLIDSRYMRRLANSTIFRMNNAVEIKNNSYSYEVIKLIQKSTSSSSM